VIDAASPARDNHEPDSILALICNDAVMVALDLETWIIVTHVEAYVYISEWRLDD
jgi:hypothetical protein